MEYKEIKIKGAREHNLKNIDLNIPRDKLVVLTGLSGSGKSSLAFDTIYAEGQRRYVESLSSYARQFLGQMEKPDVDSIEGLSPSISIDQKTTSKNPRSTVGTVTEIYDYLRLLYARVGVPHCPQCGSLIEQQSIDQIIDKITALPFDTKIMIMAPLVSGRKGEFAKLFDELRRNGYGRVRVDGEYFDLDEDIILKKNIKHNIDCIIDRLIIRENIETRLTDSVESALSLSGGTLSVLVMNGKAKNSDHSSSNNSSSNNASEYELFFSVNFACAHCNIGFEEISPRMFSFNNPFGACPHCSGLGELTDIDKDLVVDAPELSLNDGAITTGGWNFADRKSWARAHIVALSKKYNFSLDTPYKDLPQRIKNIILYGNNGEILSLDTTNTKYQHGRDYRTDFKGVITSMEKRYRETNSDEMKEYYEQFMSKTVCPQCNGARLRKESLSVLIGGINIYELTCMTIGESRNFLNNIVFDSRHKIVGDRILKEIDARLGFLNDVGLDYMTLARASGTLSGGEAQRIRLATQIGSGLMGVLYILDEPSIGLHQRDNARLLGTLKRLRDLGNSVLVVEHDEETMREADFIVDMGPLAGERGGHVVVAGDIDEVIACKESITGQYLSGEKYIPVPKTRRRGEGKYLEVIGAGENNLKNINVKFPLGVLNCVTGVSGSGKTSLVNGIILQRLRKELNGARRGGGNCDKIIGCENLDKVINIDQSPIGRTPRSNPATYTGVFDYIRDLYAQLPEAKARGYKPGRFSFNVKGGRCEACSGDGVIKIEMHFLADVYVKCDVCKGKRYNRETLQVKYKDKNISDILQMSVSEALKFFENLPRIYRKLLTLEEVGLGYIKIGQPSTQLSGGEAQRVKLATELSKKSTGKTLYILDEPTTGLHIADVHKLVDVLDALIGNGNTVIVIEHNLDVIKVADNIIDLGPEGGSGGGLVVASGTPEEVALSENSYTGQYLRKILGDKR